MSNIFVAIDDIPGDATTAGHEGQIQCDALEHGIDLQVEMSGSARVEGRSVHANFELFHKPDKASPLLRAFAAAGKALGGVKVTRTRQVGEATVPAEIFMLKNARVVYVDMWTPINGDGTAAQFPVECFHLEYEEIGWDYKHYVDGVFNANIFKYYSVHS